jgi:hypothetical protein
MRSSHSGWVRSIISIMGLSVCLVFVGLATTAGAAAPTVTSEAVSPAAATTGSSPPVIQVFKADPMTLETPTSAAVYTFKVKRAKNVAISEAGNNIKNISNPSGGALNGTATGMPASAISTDASGKFKAVLIASNDDGAVKAELTLSFSEKLLAASGKPAGESEESDNQTQSRSPKWLNQYSSPFGPPRSAMTGSEPKFFDCPSDCDYCLEPEDAKSQGMGERCSPERCYYSPDNQRNWYCFKPSPGWCCNNSQVSQATKDECTKMGGDWFLNQSDALDRCQPVGYCCQNGNITSATLSQCAQVGGIYYADVVEAKERCQPVGYCCQNGNITSATLSQCAQVGGTYYADVVEAKERCQPPCYCCAQGKVLETNRATCLQYGGTCYANQYEALERCQPPCWCCLRGQVFQSTQAACLQSGGNCYASQAEALRYCQQQSSCWCCAQGKVFQTTQAACLQSGGNCYASQAQALQYCQAQTTCWCCAGGKVFQTYQSQCSQVGGTCYTTQDQAQRYCGQQTPTTPYLK